MNYDNQMTEQRRKNLELMSGEDLYDTANGYFDFEHGLGYYSRANLVEMILNYEYKLPIQNNI